MHVYDIVEGLNGVKLALLCFAKFCKCLCRILSFLGTFFDEVAVTNDIFKKFA